jgi:hypothetical protein
MYTNLYTGYRQGVDNMASKVISTRLDESKVDELDLKASELGITRNELISKVLLEFLGVDKTVDNLYTSVDKTVDSDILKLVDSAVDNRIQFLIERIDSLENAIAKQNTTESSLLFHSEIVAPVRSDEIELEAIAANITYALNLDCSINLESIKGIEIQDLKLLESWQLKELGLKREYDEVQGKLKFFPIHSDKALKCLEPDALVSEKATSPAKKSITYQIAKDGSIVLRSLRGTDSRTLKRMNTQELKEIGLFKTLIGANEKFFPI